MDIMGLVVFFLLQLVNVILSTMRSILVIKASKKVAALFTAISYTFYNAIVKLITAQDMLIIIATTFITNLLGVYLANWILERFKKDKVWRITITIPNTIDSQAITALIQAYNISCVTFVGEGVKICDVYSKTQGESQIVKEILQNFPVKYSVVELEKSL